MKKNENHRKLMKIVMMYYQQGLTQATIAKKLGISRPVVSKQLQLAKEQGIVTISIKDETAYSTQLALALQEKYQLKEVIVTPVHGEVAVEKTAKEVSQLAAQYLAEQLRPNMSIGLSWGTTLAGMIDEMAYFSFPSITVCPLVGGVSSEHVYFDTNHLAFQLAEKLNSGCRYFYVPALAETVEFAQVLNASQMLQQSLTVAKQVDFAIIGVGNPNEHSTWQTLGYLTPAENQYILESGIKGDAVASLFDKNGQTVNNEICNRMLGIKVEDLTQIPEVMIIAYGKKKAESIQALLTSQCCSVLVIDQLLAETLLLNEGVNK